jgi:uncharacterized membrane protein YeaQ/YmgE (transglycosylase-associated protein family)
LAAKSVPFLSGNKREGSERAFIGNGKAHPARIGKSFSFVAQRAASRFPSPEPPLLAVSFPGEGELIMGIIIMLLVGILVGWLASVVVGGGGGVIFDMIVGFLGALIASFIFGGPSILSGGISLMSILWSVIGAIVLLLVLRLFRGGFARRW